MSGPTVTLTFAGDATRLDQAADRTVAATRRMSDGVAESSRAMANSTGGIDRYTEASDAAETKSQGFADVLTGVTEGFAIMTDPTASTTEKLIGLGQAGADLAGGFTAFLIPMLGTLATTLKTGLGSAMTFVAAHPLMFAMLALVAVFALLWMNSETFRTKVIAAFNAVRSALGAAWDWIVDKGKAALDFYLSMPGRILGVFTGLGGMVRDGLKAAFNALSDLWNRGPGRLSFTVPGWVPGLGGNGFSMPQIPRLHTGGVVPGPIGSEVLALLQGGEIVGDTGRGRRTELAVADGADGAVAALIQFLIRSGQITVTEA